MVENTFTTEFSIAGGAFAFACVVAAVAMEDAPAANSEAMHRA
jgi:hypothetical protein